MRGLLAFELVEQWQSFSKALTRVLCPGNLCEGSAVHPPGSQSTKKGLSGRFALIPGCV